MHIHVPDGVFPPWIWISAIIILIPLLGLAVLFLRKDTKKMVMASAITALMLIVFSVEVFGYHLNFTALSGIMLGPWWSLLSLTIVNIFLALFGHGGITVAPINVLINWIECLVAYFIFRLILRKIKNAKLKSALTGLTVFASLIVSFSLFLWVISLTGINPGLQLEHVENAGFVPLKEFAIISAIPLLISALIESVLTFSMIIFLTKVRPKLLG